MKKLPISDEGGEPVEFSEEAFDAALAELVRMGYITIVKDPSGDKYKDLIVEVKSDGEGGEDAGT